MKTITYQNNNQYWALKDALEEAGYTLKADCYWSQILRNDEGEEIGLSRETESTNNPLDDLTAVLAVEVKEETAMETINYVYVNQYVKMRHILSGMGYRVTKAEPWEYTYTNSNGDAIVLKRMHGLTNDPYADLLTALLAGNDYAGISIVNGRTYCDPAEALAVYPIDELAVYMDDDTREAVHREGVWDTELLFLLRYLSLAPHDLIIP